MCYSDHYEDIRTTGQCYYCGGTVGEYSWGVTKIIMFDKDCGPENHTGKS